MALKQLLNEWIDKFVGADELASENSDLVIENRELKDSVALLQGCLHEYEQEIETLKCDLTAEVKENQEMRRKQRAFDRAGLLVVFTLAASIVVNFVLLFR